MIGTKRAATFLMLSLLVSPGLTASSEIGGDRVMIPLSKPGEPASVSASLIRGGMTVEPYDGDTVILEVIGSRPAARDEVEPDGLRRLVDDSVSFVAEEEGNRVEISVRSWDRAVDLYLRVPRRTSLALRAIDDGDIRVEGVRGSHELSNTNGSIFALGISGTVVANSTNGAIEVEMLAVDEGQPMAVSSLNGDVEITLPSSLAADLVLRSDYGEVLTDFDLEVVEQPQRLEQGREGAGYRVRTEKASRARINGGGAEISLRSFNGDVVVRKGE